MVSAFVCDKAAFRTGCVHVRAPVSGDGAVPVTRVLLVEVDGFTRMLRCSQLREMGHEMVADVATAAEGMAVLKMSQPDLAI